MPPDSSLARTTPRPGRGRPARPPPRLPAATDLATRRRKRASRGDGPPPCGPSPTLPLSQSDELGPPVITGAPNNQGTLGAEFDLKASVWGIDRPDVEGQPPGKRLRRSVCRFGLLAPVRVSDVFGLCTERDVPDLLSPSLKVQYAGLPIS